MDEARRLIDIAHNLHASEWPKERDTLVGQLLGEARLSKPSAIPTWHQIRLAGLALHANPLSRQAQTLHLRLWAERVAWEREARGSVPEEAQVTTDRETSLIDPAVPIDAITRLTLAWLRTGDAPAMLQLGLSEPTGFRVASIPIRTSVAQGDLQSMTLDPVRRGDEILLQLRTPDGQLEEFHLQSLVPSPWGAPFYPPQPALLNALALVESTDPPRPVQIQHVELDLRLDAARPKRGDRTPLWQLNGKASRCPSLMSVRAYERVAPLPSSAR